MNNLGEDIYKALKENNRKVWAGIILSAISIIGSLVFAFMIWTSSTNNIYAINEKGELVPLEKLKIKEANLIQAKANLEYFVNQYYSLDAFSMKSKRERLLWLIGSQPQQIIKDRIKKGYFDEFLSVGGLIQYAEILQGTLKISKEAPYQASFIVRIQRVNGGVSEFYNNHITLTMEEVNRNYPYNPYGLLITQFSENLQRVAVETPEAEAQVKESEEAINQNPKEDGTEEK